MHWRRSSSGALLHAVIITFLIETSKLGTTLSIQSSQPETLVCTSTLVCRWGHTSTTCCRRVMVHWDSSGRLSGLCHHMHWTLSLQVYLVHSRLDYCNVVFAGLPACDVQRLQSILNTAIRLVAGSSRRDHVTSLLRDRHWLPVKQRVEYTSCVRLFIVVCTATHHPTWSTSSRRPLLQAPELVWYLLSRWPSQCHARSHHWETALLRPPVRVRGTSYRHTSNWCSPLPLLDVILKHFYFTRPFYHDIVRRPCCAPALTSP